MGDYATVDDAIVTDPRVSKESVILEIDGKLLFLNPRLKDIVKNRERIESYIENLMKV